MNGDIRPPRRPDASEPVPLGVPVSQSQPEGANGAPSETTEREGTAPLLAPGDDAAISKKPRRNFAMRLIIGAVTFLVLAVSAVAVLYAYALSPVDSHDRSHVRVSVKSGMNYAEIGQLLHEKKLIRSTAVFNAYTRLKGARGQFQAGAYSLSPSDSLGQIVDHLISGRSDMLTITFYPGATLRDATDTPAEKKTDVTSVLTRAGYAKAEIDAALAKSYGSRGVPSDALFDGKPAEADLEGYIYGETYSFSSDVTVEDILSHVFDVYYEKIEQQNVLEPLKRRGLSLYQGITLASIVQREVSAQDASQASVDQRQVAQVFYSRLAQNMPLGSDVTAYYGADRRGVARSVEVDTPYNTRKHTGLPPGPIAVPTIGALAAVANPAEGDYLYFLSGDDDVTYFARTDAEHQANIKNHCHVKCAIP